MLFLHPGEGAEHAAQGDEVFALALQIFKRGALLKASCLKPTDCVFGFQQTAAVFFMDYEPEKTFFLCDRNIFFNSDELAQLARFPHLFWTPSEENKNLQTVLRCLKNIPDGITHLVAMGGGITLDVGGFLAFLCECVSHYVPTTWLAAVDAGYGGKTGVNHMPYGKNQVGAFYMPKRVVCVPALFATLSMEQKLSGLGEMLKHQWLQGGDFAHSPLKTLLIEKSPAFLPSVLEKQWALKKTFVDVDPLDREGIRRYLNFGHTIAHVLEGLCAQGFLQPVLPHGVAVMWGMWFLYWMGWIPGLPVDFWRFCAQCLEHSKKVLGQPYLAVSAHEWKPAASLLLRHDKKNEVLEQAVNFESQIFFTLPCYGIVNCLQNLSRSDLFFCSVPLIRVSQDLERFFNTYFFAF